MKDGADGIVLRQRAVLNNIVLGETTLDKEIREKTKSGGNLAGAKVVGEALARRAKAKGIETVVYDRGGYRYHGRVRVLAEAAREAGLAF